MGGRARAVTTRGLLLGALVISVLVGLLSLVNGRWLDSPTRTGTTTVGGAAVVSLVTFAGLLALGAVVSWRARRALVDDLVSRHRETLWLTGYATAAAHERRRPGWEGGPVIGLQQAVADATVWVARVGGDAVVEIGSRTVGTVTVVAIVTAHGVETV